MDLRGYGLVHYFHVRDLRRFVSGITFSMRVKPEVLFALSIYNRSITTGAYKLARNRYGASLPHRLRDIY